MAKQWIKSEGEDWSYRQKDEKEGRGEGIRTIEQILVSYFYKENIFQE